MFRIIFTLTALACTGSPFSQESKAEKLLAIEKQVYVCTNDTLKQQLLLSKVDLLLANKEQDERVFREVKRISGDLLDSLSRERFYWNAALLSYLNKENYRAAVYLGKYEKMSVGKDVPFQLLGFLLYRELDSLKAMTFKRELISADPAFADLACFDQVEAYELKHRTFKHYSGYLVPGSGAMINGNIGKGLLSAGLNAASLAAILSMYRQGLWINTFGWGGNLVSKFYFGNIRMTDKLMDKKEAREKNELAGECELILEGLLKKYPLTFN